MTSRKAEHHVLKDFAVEKLQKEFLLPQVTSPFVAVGTLLTLNAVSFFFYYYFLFYKQLYFFHFIQKSIKCYSLALM